MTAMRLGLIALLLAVCACGGSDGPTADGPTATRTADSCAALLPTLPQSRTRATRCVECCGGAAADGAGNVYDLTYRSGFFQPLAEGFTSFYQSMSPSTHYRVHAPSGEEISSVPVFRYTTVAGLQANGGTILVGCGANDAAEARKFDDRGILTTVRLNDQECVSASGAAVLVDQKDRILLLRTVDSPGGDGTFRFGARWFDAAGKPLTSWFDAGHAHSRPGTTQVSLIPLIGGGAVGRAGGAIAEWMTTFVSGAAAIEPAPGFLPPNANMGIVLGGKAYAVLSRRDNQSVVEIFTASGKSCGTLATFGADHRLYLGKDGTLIDQVGEVMAPAAPPNDCVTTWYPQVLK